MRANKIGVNEPVAKMVRNLIFESMDQSLNEKLAKNTHEKVKIVTRPPKFFWKVLKVRKESKIWASKCVFSTFTFSR